GESRAERNPFLGRDPVDKIFGEGIAERQAIALNEGMRDCFELAETSRGMVKHKRPSLTSLDRGCQGRPSVRSSRIPARKIACKPNLQTRRFSGTKQRHRCGAPFAVRR